MLKFEVTLIFSHFILNARQTDRDIQKERTDKYKKIIINNIMQTTKILIKPVRVFNIISLKARRFFEDTSLFIS